MNDSADHNVIKFPKETVAEIESKAMQWLMRLDAGSSALGDLVEFEMWRAGSADRDRIYKELERIWISVGERRQPASDAVAAVTSDASPLQPRRRREATPRFDGALEPTRHPIGRPRETRKVAKPHFLDRRIGLLAAGVAALFVGGAATLQYVSFGRYDYHTAAGQIQQTTLADGTRVSLKGDTALNVHVSATGVRRVELVSGEAYFDVVHDAARPFVVDVGSGLVKDVGTGFSVERRGETGQVRVGQGVVEVDAAGQSQLLVRGQQIGFGLYRLGQRSAIDPELISAWRKGLYIAENKTLGDVLADLGEYHAGKIVLLDNGLRARRINAVVQLNRVDAWLDTLGETRGVSVRRWGPLVIVGTRPV